ESYSASSTAGSDRLNQCWRKYIRSMRSTPTGGRPLPAFGYTGSIRAPSARHGTTRSISARNCARRVVFVYFSNPVWASVFCARFIGTSRGGLRAASSQHATRNHGRLIQRFLNHLLQVSQRQESRGGHHGRIGLHRVAQRVQTLSVLQLLTERARRAVTREDTSSDPSRADLGDWG